MFGTGFKSEIARLEGWAVGEKERSFQNVAKLANISRPVVGSQTIDGFGGELSARTRHVVADLYFRISTVPWRFAAAASGRTISLAIARALLNRICSDMARPRAELSTKAVDRLANSYYWPGNIRELRNVLERALLSPTAQPSSLAISLLNPVPNIVQNSYKADWTLEELERFHITAAFSGEDQNVEKTARRLGMPRATLYQKLKTLHLI